jgi:XTP/dITP diphosphohydrolase
MDKSKDSRRQEQLAAFDRLLTIMDELRMKCPWDRKQTMESLRHLTIEETYELSDAILEGDLEEIKKELGDLMLHNVFYAKIASEKDAFDISDVLNAVCDKLIQRHPHIYGDVTADDAETVKANWEKIKLKEHGDKPRSVLGGVPGSLPSLVKAMRIQEKARGVGFDWDHSSQVVDKVKEELNEFLAEFSDGTSENNPNISAEFGDLLFSLINLSRFLDINPEEALERTNKKFIKRFMFLEKASREDGKELGNMTLEEMEHYWQKAKSI